GVETHADGRDVRAELQRRRRELGTGAVLPVFGVERVALVAEGVAEMLTLARYHVQRVVRRFIAQPIPSMIREPQLPGLRMKVEGARVAHPERLGLEHPRVGLDPHDGRLHVGRHDDVAGRADVEIELAVGSHSKELPEVAGLLVRVEVVDHYLCFRRVVEAALDTVVAGDAVALRDIQCAPAENDPVWRVEVLEYGLYLALSAAIDHRVDVLQLAGAYEYGALVALRHGACAGKIFGPDFDLETGRNLQLVHRQ